MHRSSHPEHCFCTHSGSACQRPLWAQAVVCPPLPCFGAVWSECLWPRSNIAKSSWVQHHAIHPAGRGADTTRLALHCSLLCDCAVLHGQHPLGNETFAIADIDSQQNISPVSLPSEKQRACYLRVLGHMGKPANSKSCAHFSEGKIIIIIKKNSLLFTVVFNAFLSNCSSYVLAQDHIMQKLWIFHGAQTSMHNYHAQPGKVKHKQERNLRRK